MTVTIPDELATRLEPLSGELPRILELGIQEWMARQEAGFSGLSEVIEALASLPGPEEVMALRPSAAFQARISELLEKNGSAGLSADERREWERYQYVEHLVRVAKARAAARIGGKADQ